MSDPGDSLLSAEVAGVKSLLRSAAGSDVRFSIVTFSGLTAYPLQEPPTHIVLRGEAVIQSELTGDAESLKAALERVLERGSAGNTNFAAGMRQASRTLMEASQPSPAQRRVVLFISDSPSPLQIGPNTPNMLVLRRDPMIARAAVKAIDSGIVFHTFGLGKAAATQPPHMLSRIAGATGGDYHAVGDATGLHCHLLQSLAQPRR